MSSFNSNPAVALSGKQAVPGFVATCLEWVRAQQATFILARPPIHLPAGITSISRHGKLLADQCGRDCSPGFQIWPDASVGAWPHPVMVAVVEGEVDFRIGVTQKMKRASPNLPGNRQLQLLQPPERSLLLIPSGVPFSNGDPHWERSDIENANSCLLWVSFIDHGILTYYCCTRNARHSISSTVFIHDPSLLRMAELLIENMTAHGGKVEQVDQVLMQVILLCIERNCRSLEDELAAWPEAGEDEEFTRLARSVVHRHQDIERACEYIDLHIRQPLNVAQIAAHAMIPSARLNDLFQEHLGTSVMAYVGQQRINLAKVLLHETDLPIREVSRLAGFGHPTYFSHAFAKITKQRPRQYRQSRVPRFDSNPLTNDDTAAH